MHAAKLTAALIFMVLLSGLPIAHAEQAVSVSSDSTIQTDSGHSVVLAGIVPTPETYTFLKNFLPGRAITLEEAPSGAQPGITASRSVYLFLTLRELDMPIRPGQIPRENRVMLNQELLRMGLARVREDGSFSKKDDFLAIQAEAKRTGQGIWSYLKPE